MSVTEDPLAYVRYQLKIWRFLRIIPPETKTGCRRAFIFHFVTSFLFLTTMLIGCMKATNFEELSWSVSFTMSVGCSALRNLPIARRRKNSSSVKVLLESLTRRASQNPNEVKIIEAAISKSQKLFKFIFITFIMSTTMFEMGIVFVFNKRILFMPAWMPFDWKNNTMYYVIAHIFQYSCILGQATMASVIDTLPSANMIIIKAHLEVLAIRTSRIGFESEAYHDLICCIKDHKDLLKLFDELFETISASLMILVVFNAATQCSFAVSIINTDFESGVVLTLILMCSTFQTLIPCYFADNMRYESEMLVSAIGSCNWVDQDKHFRRALLFFIQRAQKPLELLAGGYIRCSLATFLQIQKLAYSMFVVFRK